MSRCAPKAALSGAQPIAAVADTSRHELTVLRRVLLAGIALAHVVACECPHDDHCPQIVHAGMLISLRWEIPKYRVDTAPDPRSFSLAAVVAEVKPERMLKLFAASTLVLAFMAALSAESRALPNCSYCSGEAYCKNGGNGTTCMRSCSDGVCICGETEVQACS